MGLKLNIHIENGIVTTIGTEATPDVRMADIGVMLAAMDSKRMDFVDLFERLLDANTLKVSKGFGDGKPEQ